MEEFKHPSARMAGRHQGRNGTEAAAAALVAAHPEQDVVEEIEGVTSGFKEAKALGRSLRIEKVAGSQIGRPILKPGDRRPEVVHQVVVLAHDEPIHQTTWIDAGVVPSISGLEGAVWEIVEEQPKSDSHHQGRSKPTIKNEWEKIKLQGSKNNQ
jgi:hypothetical protein